MSEEQQPIIVVKRIKKGGGGHHGGAWKVAFADFMTAMMAFFMVMWLVGQPPEVRENIAGFFREPGKFSSQGKSGVLKGSGTSMNKSPASKNMIPSKASINSASEAEKKQLLLKAKHIAKELMRERAFKRLKDNIKIQMSSEGLRIILNESENSPAFFEPGSSKLLQKSAVILVTLAKELGTLDNKLVIEGHTDASYAGRKGYSNWELSADRANAARQLMEVSGLYADQVMEVRGFADQFPMIDNNPNDQRNRRVSIVVLYKSREAQYDKLEVGEDILADIN